MLAQRDVFRGLRQLHPICDDSFPEGVHGVKVRIPVKDTDTGTIRPLKGWCVHRLIRSTKVSILKLPMRAVIEVSHSNSAKIGSDPDVQVVKVSLVGHQLVTYGCFSGQYWQADGALGVDAGLCVHGFQ